MWLLLVLFGILILHFILQVRKAQSYWKIKGAPFEKPWFFIGNVASTVFRTQSVIDKQQSLYNAFPDKRYVGLYHFLRPVILIRDPELIKTITVKEFDSFPDHTLLTSAEVDPIISRSLFTLSLEDGWHTMRSKVTPTFTGSKLKAMFSLMDKCALQFADYFCKEENVADGIEVKDAFARFANDVIATTAFGINVDSLENPQNQFYLKTKDLNNFEGIRVLKFFGYAISPGLMKVFKISPFSKSACTALVEIIKNTLKFREENPIVRPDIINLLLKAKRDYQMQESKSATAEIQESKVGKALKHKLLNITDDDIAATALSFLFAGFDSTSTLMCYVAYELALNSSIQRKLKEEIDVTLKECEGKLTYEALVGMRYLDKIISETLRKWPPEAGMDRSSKRPFTIDAENPGEQLLYLESGTVCWISIFGMHRDPKYYPDPEKFDPERFSEENKHKIKPFSYLPFGSGPRSCIGSRFAVLETKLIILRVLQRFEIFPVKKTQIPINFSTKSYSMLPEGGFWLGLKPRPLYR